MRNCSLFILLAFILSSCVVRNSSAPIEYNHHKSNVTSSREAVPIIDTDEEIISSGVVEPKESEFIVPNDKDDNTGDSGYVVPAELPVKSDYKIIYHEVQVGEVIEEIASQYGQKVDEIAMLNDLRSPYHLTESQIIKIKVPKDFVKNKAVEIVEEPTEPEAIAEEQKSDSVAIPIVEFIQPVEGTIITKFGEKTQHGINKGLSIAAKQGTKVVAAASGKVIYADYDATFGNLVIIKLNNKNVVTSYAHLEDIILSKGSSINQGDIVGYVGSTGKVKESQLHFGIREGKVAKDPLGYISY